MPRKIVLKLEPDDARRLEHYIRDEISACRRDDADLDELSYAARMTIDSAERILGLLLAARAAATGRIT